MTGVCDAGAARRKSEARGAVGEGIVRDARGAKRVFAVIAAAWACASCTPASRSQSLSHPSDPPARPSASSASVVPASASAEPRGNRASAANAGREGRLIAKMLKRVSEIRGITASKPVPGVVLTRAELIERVKSHVAKEIPAESIRNEGLVLQLLGFVPTEFDYEAAEYALLEAQLAGYYEPEDGTMYLAADLSEGDAEATLAHELVHALQDQRWDLKSRSKYRPGDGDVSSAVSALAEGDATSAMFDVMFAKAGKVATDLPDELYAEQIRESMKSGPTASSPQIMRNSLASPYIYGTMFVHALRRRGGWPEVNAAWDHAPTTSEQILHVAKWDAREAEIGVEPPPIGALGAGWSVVDADVYGELGLRLTLEEWLTPERAAIAATGWGGDRGVLVKNQDRIAFAWRIRFDESAPHVDALARRAFEYVAPALRNRAGKANMLGNADQASGASAFFCVENLKRGPLAIARAGNDVIFVAGPASAAASGWSSAGTCAQAKGWTDEIAKSR